MNRDHLLLYWHRHSLRGYHRANNSTPFIHSFRCLAPNGNIKYSQFYLHLIFPADLTCVVPVTWLVELCLSRCIFRTAHRFIGCLTCRFQQVVGNSELKFKKNREILDAILTAPSFQLALLWMLIYWKFYSASCA